MNQQEQNILHSIEEKLEQIRSLEGLGSTYKAQGRFKDAERCHLEVIQIFKDIEQDFQQTGATGEAFALYIQVLEAKADSFSELGSISKLLNQPEAAEWFADAIDSFEQTQQLKRQSGDLQGAADSLHKKGIACTSVDKLDEAARTYEEESRIGRQINDRFIQARALLSLANTYEALGEYVEAISTYKRSFDQWDEENLAEKARCRNEIGFIYHKINRNDEAIENHSEAQSIAQTTSDSDENFALRLQEGIALRGLGDVDRRKGDNLIAIYKYEQAKSIFEKIANRVDTRSELAWTLLDLGSAYSNGNTDEAESNLKKAQQLFEDIHELSGEAEAKNRLGNLYSHIDNQLATQHYNRAVELYDKSGNRRGKSSPLHNLGLIASEKEQYKDATNLLQQSLEIRGGSEPTLEAITRCCLGNAYKKWGEQYCNGLQYKEAVEYLELALEYFNSILPQFRIEREQESDQKLEEQAQKKLAEAYRKLGDSYFIQGQQEYEKERYENAIREWLEAKESFNRIKSDFRTKDEQESDVEAKSEVEKKLGEAEKNLIEARRASSQVNRKEGNYQAEIELLKSLLQLMRKLENRIEVANALLGLGDVYHATGNYGDPDLSPKDFEEEPTSASEAYRRALKIYEKIDSSNGRLGEAKVLIGLGKTYHSLGQCQRALELLGKGGI